MSDPSETHSTDESRDDARFGRILNDFLDRRARGEPVSEEQLYADHPEFADELREALEVVGELRPSSTDIQDLLARGGLAPCPDPGYVAQLGAYKVRRLVGRGGMGVVLEAHEESLDRTVALKILRPDLSQDNVAVGRFAHEARAAAALRHPNIVTVYAVGEDRGTSFIAMELIEGLSLADVIREHGPLPTAMTRKVFEQLMAGLAAAHDAGLIHRDIKPSNILLDRFSAPWQAEAGTDPSSVRAQQVADGGPSSPPLQGGVGGGSSPVALSDASFIVKITDFGLARMLSAQTRMTMPNSVLGTPEYMSPEQARGDEDIDHRTDLYSAGVVLYEMLTGRTPFKADTPSAVIHQILHTEPPEPGSINPTADSRLTDLALRLMAKQREGRVGSRVCVYKAIKTHGAARQARGVLTFHWKRTLGAVAFILLCAGMWLFSTLVGNPRIADVKVEGDSRTQVMVRYEGDDEWQELHRFSQEGAVMAYKLVDPDGVAKSGDELVVVGTHMPEDGHNLFAFDSRGKSFWSTYLASTERWPDCSSIREWSCEQIRAADIDGAPGDELVVVASDIDEYPTLIAVVDPNDGTVQGRFWNLGNISDIKVEADYFGPGQPAIIAWGCNNKLDGFGTRPPRPYKPPPGEDEPETDYDIVSVVMVLDPQRMERGISPPRIPSFPEPADQAPYAYAMMNLPHGTAGSESLEEERFADVPKVEETAQFVGVRRSLDSPPHDSGPWLECGVAGQLGPSGSRPGALILVDRHLGFRKAIPASYERIGATETYWRHAWRPLVQNYKGVRENTSTPFRLLRAVDIEKDEIGQNTITIVARYDNNLEWQVFREFPREAEQVIAVVKVTIDRQGTPLVVAGVERAVGDACLFAFSSNGEPRWELSMTPRPNIDWPDRKGRRRPWGVSAMITGDIDDDEGEEIIVAGFAGNNEYQTRISIVKPYSDRGEICSTFWHFGHVNGLLPLPGFFADGHHAIVAWGANNKLDGFGDPPIKDYQAAPGEDVPRTIFDMVPVVMVLDPAQMNGIGPPLENTLRSLRGDQPVAYAFLNVPLSTKADYYVEDLDARQSPVPDETAKIVRVRESFYARDDGTAPWLELETRAVQCDGTVPKEACPTITITVDRTLEWQRFDTSGWDAGDSIGTEWRKRWNVIIRDGEYLAD